MSYVSNCIADDFISNLKMLGEKNSFVCNIYVRNMQPIKRIIELKGSLNCFIYFKIRSGKPYTWGITKSRIDNLQNSGENWFILLLFETPNNGYIIKPKEAKRYREEGLWPMGHGKNKNEYKIGPGTRLQYSHLFNNSEDFLSHILNN